MKIYFNLFVCILETNKKYKNNNILWLTSSFHVDGCSTISDFRNTNDIVIDNCCRMCWLQSMVMLGNFLFLFLNHQYIYWFKLKSQTIVLLHNHQQVVDNWSNLRNSNNITNDDIVYNRWKYVNAHQRYYHR